MPFTRYGHVNQVFVKIGDTVNVGQKIATNGTGNGQWLAHLHRDHPKTIPDGNFGFYNIGWTKEKTFASFADPNTYPKALGAGYSHLGYGWLEEATYAGGKCFHPGLDENGKGSGNDDYDGSVYAVADGIVRYVYSGTGSNGGWGKIIVVEEIIKEEPMEMTKDLKEAVELLGVKAGEKLNDKEQDRLAGEIRQMKLTNVRLLANNEELAKKLADQEKVFKAYTEQAGKCEPELATCKDNLRIQTEKANDGISAYSISGLFGEIIRRLISSK